MKNILKFFYKYGLLIIMVMIAFITGWALQYVEDPIIWFNIFNDE